MQTASKPAAVAGVAFLAAAGAPCALNAAADDAALHCPDKANLTNVTAAMSSAQLLEGVEPESVADDVLMIDIDLSVENAGGADASASRIGYSAKISSVDGALVESSNGVTTLYWTPAGGTERAQVTIMASLLSRLVQPDGSIAGSVDFRAEVDVDGEIDECDESDNAVQLTAELKVGGTDQPS